MIHWKINNKSIEVENENKLMFPDTHVTKEDMIEYYEKVAEYLLPHLRSRAISMHRYPDGLNGEDFYQKSVPDYFPDWINRVQIKKEQGTNIQMTVEKEEDLIFLADQATITIHIWLSQINKIHYPDKLIFDLDPPESLALDKGFELVKEGAFAIKKLFKQLRLNPLLMTTGSKGLHVVTIIKKELKFDEVREFSEKIAKYLVDQHPDKFTTEIRKNKRKGRLFLDTLRNAYAQTSVVPYSLRARSGAPVSTPLDWDELASLENAQSYTIRNIFRRLGQKKDPWHDIYHRPSSLKIAQNKMQSLTKAR